MKREYHVRFCEGGGVKSPPLLTRSVVSQSGRSGICAGPYACLGDCKRTDATP